MADTVSGSEEMVVEPGSTKSADPQLISIGQLVRELQLDFPDLSISKVRYLEDRGLISPQRTKGKYRKFSKADARRLRGILTMQRDEYLPLEVIRRRVDSPRQMGSIHAGPYSPSETITLGYEEPVYTIEEFCETLGVPEEFVLGLVEFRLLERTSETGPAFTESDLETAHICLRLAHFQVEPRHLRMLSSAAEREAGLIEQIATPDLRSGHADRKEYGLETVQELSTLFTELNQILLRRELRRLLSSSSP